MRKSMLFLAGILLVASSAFAQHEHPAGAAPTEQKTSMDCGSMMQEMHAASKAMDDRIQTLVDEMNKAKGSSKVDRTAAVINELVSQRKQMREQMMAMMPKMMEHMTQHMQSGMMSGMSQSMAGCPMMKGAEKTPDVAPTEHKH